MSWIKIRTNLATDPAVAAIGMRSKRTIADVVLALYRLACWFEQHGDYGRMQVTAGQMDSYIGFPIFDLLNEVGFLRVESGVVLLKRFTTISGTRKSIGRRLRAEVLASGKCAECGEAGTLEIDHIIPVSKGGRTERKNLQPLCMPCNRKKGAKTL